MLISVVFIVSKILLVECAPKIGHVLFDPLLYEAAKDNIEDTDAPVDHTSSDDDDFLVNAPSIESSPQPLLVSQLKDIIKDNMSENSKISPGVLREGSFTSTITGNSPLVKKESKDVLRNIENGGDAVVQYGYEFDQTICKEVNNVIMCGYNKNQGDLNDQSVPVPNKEGCVIRHDRIECGYVKGGNQAAKLLRSQSMKYLSINSTDPFDQLKLALRTPVDSSSIFDTTFSSTFPADSARVTYKTEGSAYSESINSDSEPLHNAKIKVTTNFDPETIYTIKLNVANSGRRSTLGLSNRGVSILSALTSGKMKSLLTSRAGSIPTKATTRQIPTRTTTNEILTENSSASTKETVTSPELMTIRSTVLVTASPTSKLPSVTTVEDKVALRNKEAILKDIEGESPTVKSGCSSCLLNPFLKKQGLRNFDEISTRKCVTRCVEIGDRIVCYPFKFKTTTPVTP